MRNIRVSTISFQRQETVAESLRYTLNLVDRAGAARPDIIALPELCINSRKSAESVPGPITEALGERARSIGCYIIAPVAMREKDGSLYNAAVMIDQDGSIGGIYRKMFPTVGEMAGGIMPGVDAPVFKTPLGRIGISICFDLNFKEVIESLEEGQPELLFFISAYEGGRQIQRWALDYSVYVVSAHRGGIGSIIDKSGHLLQKGDGLFNPIVTRDLNMDREILHIDHNWKKMDRVFAKYGKAVHVDVYRPEAIMALESRSADVSVKEIMAEFELETFKEYMERSRAARAAMLQREQMTK